MTCIILFQKQYMRDLSEPDDEENLIPNQVPTLLRFVHASTKSDNSIASGNSQASSAPALSFSKIFSCDSVDDECIDWDSVFV